MISKIADSGRKVVVASRKLLSVCLLPVLFTAFTVEYVHLIDELIAHLHQGSTPHQASGASPHRCHNCVTSQPQGQIATWNFQPASSTVLLLIYTGGPALNLLPLLKLPPERAPPVL
ncbi:MAG: hypothetical protein HY644_07055 [Acidobacteria bacterium]|nr:hypothetical protein [Acidobacteriota bacterium]